jgi:hypothetical protein
MLLLDSIMQGKAWQNWKLRGMVGQQHAAVRRVACGHTIQRQAHICTVHSPRRKVVKFVQNGPLDVLEHQMQLPLASENFD